MAGKIAAAGREGLGVDQQTGQPVGLAGQGVARKMEVLWAESRLEVEPWGRCLQARLRAEAAPSVWEPIGRR